MTYIEIIARALIVISVTWIIFLLFPQIDIIASGLFLIDGNQFVLNPGRSAFGSMLDRHRELIFYGLMAVVLGTQIGVNLWRNGRIGLDRFQLVFIVLAFAVGPGLVANVLFKDQWGRARPSNTVAFGGTQDFSPPLVISDQCHHNCSFVAGDAAFAFAFLAFALVTQRRRRLHIAAAIGFGILVGIGRMAKGAHFFSDVIFAGIFMTLTTVLLYKFVVEQRCIVFHHKDTKAQSTQQILQH